ncbi:MAG: MotA/TolQ/ExbB proton channel family protein [Gammaproteobacteria bacterium]|nr:MotA/TolQ/ExbB proton channel family protein [Gammaproteobacteria bacterium]
MINFDLLTQMDKGGPIMWVIFVAACIAFAMLIWQGLRVFTLIKYARNDYQSLLADSAHNLIQTTEETSPAAQILRQMNWKEVYNKDDMIKEMNIQLAGITPKIEGSLPTIATLGALLPMLGLLGTVTGMINVFEVIALHGTGKPEQMASGISQALLTTASGLIFAIPVIFLHHLLSRKVNELMVTTSQTMQILIHRDITSFKQG